MIGWAVGRDQPLEAVEIVYHDRVLVTAPVRGARADVSAALGIDPGVDCVFHALVGLVGLKLNATLEVRAVFEDGSRMTVGTVSVQRRPLETEYEPMLAPLLVTTVGRSGSTWLMQILAAHPQVVVFRRFPYESAPAKYWLHMLRVLSQPANFVESAHTDTFHNDIHWVGSNPYHDDRVYEQPLLEAWFGRTYVQSLAEFTKRRIDEWYLSLARTQTQAAPAFFAEKHLWPNFLPGMTWELYPRAKEVFLVRDFRDMASSVLSFDDRRGYPGFGRPAGASDEDYLRGGLRQMAVDLRNSWLSRADRAHLVRYEELVVAPEQTVTAMLAYLGLDSSAETLQHVLAKGSEEVLDLPGASNNPK